MSKTSPAFALPLALIAIAAAPACRETPKAPSPLPPITSPIPERAPGAASLAESPADKPPDPGQPPPLDRLVSGPLPLRFSTPGQVRWTVELGAPITYVRWSPLTGLVVSSGGEVHNVTSWGQQRWYVVAGQPHRLFAVGENEVVWSPGFQRLSEIRRWGRQGWQRKWSGELVGDEERGFFLVDAATVAAVGEDGKDRWRASLEGLRRIEGPFACDEGSLFHGIRGLEGVAVTITNRGAVMRETLLERGAVVLGAGKSCDPLVWYGDEVALLDARGIKQWRQPAPSVPIVRRLPGGFLLANYAADKPVSFTAVRDDGTVEWRQDLPVSGRVTDIGLLPAANLRLRAAGLCLDVSSPCARPGGDRGPYNAVLTPASDGELRALIHHTSGHLAYAPHPAGGLVLASSSEEDATELTLRSDGDDSVIWQTLLPGRLSAGPHVGPDGEVYVATCSGWSCSPPYLLVSVTGVEPEKEDTP